MISGKLQQYTDFILQYFNGYEAGQGLFFRTIEINARKIFPDSKSYNDFLFVYFQLLGNDILDGTDNGFIKLTQTGFETLNSGEVLELPIHFDYLSVFNQGLLNNPEKVFPQLWQIIGVESECLCYVPGSMFYNTIAKYINGLAGGYSAYIADLKVKGKKQSRFYWYKDLFYSLPEDRIEIFLKDLSDAYNTSREGGIENEVYSFPVTAEDKIVRETEKPIKLFISHSSMDKSVALALVELLEFLKIDGKDKIFCSSVPGYGVNVGEDLYERIKREYEQYNLFMIYLISANYLNSPMSLNEMGAAWLLKNEYQVFLLPELSIPDLGNVCIGTNHIAILWDAETLQESLNDFKNKLISLFCVAQPDENRWLAQSKKFMKVFKTPSTAKEEPKNLQNIAATPSAVIKVETIRVKGGAIVRFKNVGNVAAENFLATFDHSDDDYIITGEDVFPLEFLKPNHKVEIKVHLFIGSPSKTKVNLSWMEQGKEYNDVEMVVFN